MAEKNYVKVGGQLQNIVGDGIIAYSKEIKDEVSEKTQEQINTELQQGLEGINEIESLIPAQASSSNQLADKNFVNNQVSTNTANFVGTYNSLAELQAVQNPTNNDYGFVIETDAQGNEYYDRYKYNGSQWLFEYKVESTSFTAEQWAAIQSGITSALVSKLSALPTNTELETQLNGKQATLVSGTNIKTINNQSIVGAGNIEIGGAVDSVNGKTGVVVLNATDVGAATAAQGAKADTALQPSDVDSEISSTSEHPVQNKVVKQAIDNKLSEVVINNIPSESVTIINDLITGGATNVLSAEQGKAINDIIRTDIVVAGENLFDGTVKTGVPWPGFVSQKYIEIPVEASTKYSINLGVEETPQYNQVAYFNDSNTKISNIGITYSSGKASFTTPENCVKAIILVSNISSLRNCYVVKGNDTNNYVPNKYLKFYEPRNEADSRYSEILTLLGTKVSTTECLNKTYFSEKKRGVPWSGYATCDYYDIPRELFDDVLFLWETNNTSLYSSTLVIRLIDNNDNLLALNTGYDVLKLYLSYSIARIRITAENIKTIRLVMYNWTDAQINNLFIGSDKDADYTSWEWVKFRTVPPVSDLPYYGINEDLVKIIGTKPSYQGVVKKVSNVNLLNVNDVEITGAASSSPYNPLYRSNYIAVDADTLYTLSIDGVVSSYSYGILFYDSNKEYISSTNNHRHTTPSNCAFVRIDITNYVSVGSVDGTEQWQYQKGEITAYESYYQYVNNDIKTPLSGKRIAVIGDSFTASGAWFSVMCNKLGAFGKYNAAVSGGRWSDTAEPNCAYEQAQSIVNSGISMDYVLCVLGVNDYSNNIPLGDIVYSDDIATMDLNTITGGIQACIAYLRNNMPSAVIKIGYTPAGQFYNPVYPNLTTIIERMKEIALLYGVDYIETRCLGLSKYITDQHDCWESISGGHPVGEGFTIIGEGMARLMACNL